MIVLILLVLLIATDIWKPWTTPVVSRGSVVSSGANTVHLTLPQSVAAVSSTASASDARSLAIIAPVSAVPAIAPVAKPLVAKTSSVRLPVITHSCQQAGWYVQLGAFGKMRMAESLRQKVDKLGVKACVGTLSVNHLFRVLVGPQTDKNAAGLAAMGIGQKAQQKGAYPQYWAPQ